MRKQKHSMLFHTWDTYEFYLYIPEAVNRNSKPFIFFNYLDPNDNRTTRVRKFIGQNKGNKGLIETEAKKQVIELIHLLENNWNPITSSYNSLQITPSSSISKCIEYWLQKRTESFKNQSIGKGTLKNATILMNHFIDYLDKAKLLNRPITSINPTHIREFLDLKAFERSWGKVTYNTYLIDINTFFYYLEENKIIKENCANRVPRKNTKGDSSRFKVFEKLELQQVSNLLANDKRYFGLHVATKLLYLYNIRPIEITRIQVKDLDFTKHLLTLPSFKTKNRNEARFLLNTETEVLLNTLINDASGDWYIFGNRNKPTPIQIHKDYFGQKWRSFKKDHNLPNHLKLYALKHTSNYYDIESGSSYEEIRQRNRHANLQITTLYIKERLFKNVIKPSEKMLF